MLLYIYNEQTKNIMRQLIIQAAVEDLMTQNLGLSWSQAYRTMYEVYGLLAQYENFRKTNKYGSFLATLED
jgi:hypothetical protein